MSQNLELDLALLLPAIEDTDACVEQLTTRLAAQRGIEQAHVVRENGAAKLCLHVDPNLVSLAQVERLAREAGAAVSDRYRHEQIPLVGLDAADNAETSASWRCRVSSGTYNRPRAQSIARSCQKLVSCSAVHTASDAPSSVASR